MENILWLFHLWNEIAFLLQKEKKYNWEVSQPQIKVIKKAEIRNRYNQVPHLTKDTTLESDKNTRKFKHHTLESQEAISFKADDHKTRKHDKYETFITKLTHKSSTPLERSVKTIFSGFMVPTSSLFKMSIKTNRCLVCIKDP